jgi:bifunctional DNA-binding transcriptional regulator/antitoxin component of YhaV-PrlF toxin-antitoxin module
MANSDKMAGLHEEATPVDFSTAGSKDSWRLKVGKDGRVVIPAIARAQMQLGPEGTVIARMVDGELRLTSPNVSLRRLQDIAMKYKKPEDSVVDEFIAERRAEAAQQDS